MSQSLTVEITVEITQVLIDAGVPDNNESCVIALAVRPHIAPGQDVLVFPYSLGFSKRGVDGGAILRAPQSPEVQDFIRDFDKGGSSAVSPCTLTISIPDAIVLVRELEREGGDR